MRLPEATRTWLRLIRPGGLRPVAEPWIRLVCFPHAGGSAQFFRPWRAELPPDVELYAVQYPGRLDRSAERSVDDMAELAEAVTTAILPLTDRPVALFGHSLGSAVAYEVARRLCTRPDAAPARLFVSGRPGPGRQRRTTRHLATDDVLWAETGRLGGTDAAMLRDAELREVFLPVLRSDYRLAETYRPADGPPLPCPISVLVSSGDTEVTPDEARAWSACTTAGFTIRVFSGDHFYLGPRRAEVADEVVRRMAGSVPRLQPGWVGP